MAELSEIRVGDTVRVIRRNSEGRVLAKDENGVQIDTADGIKRWFDSSYYDCEILERKLKVGDEIEGSDAHDALPAGAVLNGTSGPILRTRNGFVDLAGDHYPDGDLCAKRTVIYLPNA